jgi:hypothetical protein
MNPWTEKAVCPVRQTVFASVVLAGLTCGYLAFHPCPNGGTEAGDAAAVAERFARRNGWEKRADRGRPGEVVFLVDPGRCQSSVSVSLLQITAPEEWQGIVRIETIVTAAGEVDPTGGFLWGGLWFFGDDAMLDQMLPELR